MSDGVDWSSVVSLVDEITARLGGKIYDNRCGKFWDAGQAICAEMYGADWMNDAGFLASEANKAGAPVPHGFWASAKRLARGDIPEWVGFKDGESHE